MECRVGYFENDLRCWKLGRVVFYFVPIFFCENRVVFFCLLVPRCIFIARGLICVVAVLVGVRKSMVCL